MQWEIIIIAAIIILIFTYNGRINTNKFFKDNLNYLKKFREEDYDFLLKTKRGDEVDVDAAFDKRIQIGVISAAVVLVLFIGSFSFITIIVAVVAGIFMFKSEYMNLKNYYKKHMHTIDSMLPYYLKGLEILIQHYTVPVAIGKSINDAPDVFKKGLQKLIDDINSGDSSIDPYMDFAKEYPVRDSMRMMRLLYRLSLGRQERKQEQLLTFSRTISNLQQKARDTRYQKRLEKMEGKTMAMLITTGVGVMILLIIAVMMMINV